MQYGFQPHHHYHLMPPGSGHLLNRTSAASPSSFIACQRRWTRPYPSNLAQRLRSSATIQERIVLNLELTYFNFSGVFGMAGKSDRCILGMRWCWSPRCIYNASRVLSVCKRNHLSANNFSLPVSSPEPTLDLYLECNTEESPGSTSIKYTLQKFLPSSSWRRFILLAFASWAMQRIYYE